MIILSRKGKETSFSDWFLGILSFVAALVGLLSSICSADGVIEGPLGRMSARYVGAICWAVGGGEK